MPLASREIPACKPFSSLNPCTPGKPVNANYATCRRVSGDRQWLLPLATPPPSAPPNAGHSLRATDPSSSLGQNPAKQPLISSSFTLSYPRSPRGIPPLLPCISWREPDGGPSTVGSRRGPCRSPSTWVRRSCSHFWRPWSRSLHSYFPGRPGAWRSDWRKPPWGMRFLLLGGACTESLKGFNENNIRDAFKILLPMRVVMMFGGHMPVIKVQTLRLVLLV